MAGHEIVLIDSTANATSYNAKNVSKNKNNKKKQRVKSPPSQLIIAEETLQYRVKNSLLPDLVLLQISGKWSSASKRRGSDTAGANYSSASLPPGSRERSSSIVSAVSTAMAINCFEDVDFILVANRKSKKSLWFRLGNFVARLFSNNNNDQPQIPRNKVGANNGANVKTTYHSEEIDDDDDDAVVTDDHFERVRQIYLRRLKRTYSLSVRQIDRPDEGLSFYLIKGTFEHFGLMAQLMCYEWQLDDTDVANSPLGNNNNNNNDTTISLSPTPVYKTFYFFKRGEQRFFDYKNCQSREDFDAADRYALMYHLLVGATVTLPRHNLNPWRNLMAINNNDQSKVREVSIVQMLGDEIFDNWLVLHEPFSEPEDGSHQNHQRGPASSSNGNNNGKASCCFMCTTCQCCDDANDAHSPSDNNGDSEPTPGASFCANMCNLWRAFWYRNCVANSSYDRNPNENDRNYLLRISTVRNALTLKLFPNSDDEDEALVKFWHLMPVNDIRQYFGEKIGFYFAWLEFLLFTMFIPAIIGALFFLAALIYYSIDAAEIIRNSNSTIVINSSPRPLSATTQTPASPRLVTTTPGGGNSSNNVTVNIGSSFFNATSNFEPVVYINNYHGDYHQQQELSLAVVVSVVLSKACDNYATPVFAAIVLFWGASFVEMWHRRSCWYAYLWHVENVEATEFERPKGTRLRIARVLLQSRYGARYLLFIPSIVVTLIFCCLVFASVYFVNVFNVFSFQYCIYSSAAPATPANDSNNHNYNGATSYNTASISNNNQTPELYQQIACVVVDAGRVVINSLSIMLLDWLYSHFVYALTDLECHSTQTQYNDALIVKMFAFRFVNSYSVLFFVAFGVASNLIDYPAAIVGDLTPQQKRLLLGCGTYAPASLAITASTVTGNLLAPNASIVDTTSDDLSTNSDDRNTCMALLTKQLLGCILTKPLVRSTMDVIVPKMFYLWRLVSMRTRGTVKSLATASAPAIRTETSFNNDGAPSQQQPASGSQQQLHPHAERLGDEIVRQYEMPVLSTLDREEFTMNEYMDRVIMYGALIMFSVALPPAPLIGLIFMRVDSFLDIGRMVNSYRRPIPFRAQDIGIWEKIINFLTYCGVLTNPLVVILTSHWGSRLSVMERVWTFLLFEHGMFFVRMLATTAINQEPRRLLKVKLRHKRLKDELVASKVKIKQA